MQARKEDKNTRRASPGKYRVTGYDQYEKRDFYVSEFDDLEEAIALLSIKRASPNAIPVSFSDVYFVYDDKEVGLYRATHDGGLENL